MNKEGFMPTKRAFYTVATANYQKDYLSKLPLPIIKILAEFIYKPREIRPLPHWQVGYTEGNLTSYRNFLKRLWGLLLSKSNKPVKLTITWYNNIKLAIP